MIIYNDILNVELMNKGEKRNKLDIKFKIVMYYSAEYYNIRPLPIYDYYN